MRNTNSIGKIFLIFIFSTLSCNGQQTSNDKKNELKIKKAIVTYLKWYKLNQLTDFAKITDTNGKNHPILVYETVDTITRVNIDMKVVEYHIDYLKASGILSNTYLNNTRAYYQYIADMLNKSNFYPTSHGRFAIPGLNLDPVFGFEPEEVLDHIAKGRVTNVAILNSKALARFDISATNKTIFVLSRVDGKWLIDGVSFDASYMDKVN